MAGRPQKYVDMDEIKHMLAFDCHLDEIAAILDVSRSTSVEYESMLIEVRASEEVVPEKAEVV